MIVLRTFLSLALTVLFSGTRNLGGYATDEIERYKRGFADIRLRLQQKFRGCSEVLFMAGYLLAGWLFGASMVKPYMALSGMVSVLSACLFARLLFTDDTRVGQNFVLCNTMLIGLSLGYVFEVSTVHLLFTACAGILTLMLTVNLHRVFRHSFRLPIMTGMIAYMLS